MNIILLLRILITIGVLASCLLLLIFVWRPAPTVYNVFTVSNDGDMSVPNGELIIGGSPAKSTLGLKAAYKCHDCGCMLGVDDIYMSDWRFVEGNMNRLGSMPLCESCKKKERGL